MQVYSNNQTDALVEKLLELKKEGWKQKEQMPRIQESKYQLIEEEADERREGVR